MNKTPDEMNDVMRPNDLDARSPGAHIYGITHEARPDFARGHVNGS
jgi:hypothetical protein